MLSKVAEVSYSVTLSAGEYVECGGLHNRMQGVMTDPARLTALIATHREFKHVVAIPATLPAQTQKLWSVRGRYKSMRRPYSH